MSVQINTGIEEGARQKVAVGLGRLLADSYTLYLKTHNFHWNVTGPDFKTLHVMFEEHYTELATAVDEIAERIRALGALAPGSYMEYSKLTSISEEDGNRSAKEMVKSLMEGHEAVVLTAREILAEAQSAGDEVTIGLITDRMTVHEKTAWMLRSLLEV